MSQGGIDAGQVQRMVDQAARDVERRLLHEVEQVRAELRHEISRLEDEMRDVGRMIVAEMRQQTTHLGQRIEQQTVAVVGGVAANTAMLERTRSQIEEDFSSTRAKIGLQTEANLQVEVGKKVADSVALRGKLRAFSTDVRARFDKAVEGVFLNRQLYNLNFERIRQEFDGKLRTIGAHIFRIRDADIAPAVAATRAPLQEIHSLPIEVDQMRLQARSQQLEQSVEILRACGFESIRTAQDQIERALSERFALTLASGAARASSSVVALRAASALSEDVFLGRTALEVGQGQAARIDAAARDLDGFVAHAADGLAAAARGRGASPPTAAEAARLMDAARRLAQRGLASSEAVTLLEDVLASGKLKLVR